MKSNQNYAIIDNASGYVWGVYSAESPEAACAAATLNDGGEIATYESTYQLASNESGYTVYAAPAGLTVNDGQDADEIDAVEALPLIGKFRRMADAEPDEVAEETDIEYRIAVDGGRDIAFSGEQVAYVLSQCRNREGKNYSGSSGRWTELTLYKTKGGSFVCEKVECTNWQGERNRYFGAVCKTDEEIVAFFGQGWLAKKLYDEAGIDAAIRIE